METDVPFKIQRFLYDELSKDKLARLDTDLIIPNFDVILELGMVRHVDGYTKWGSEMYDWTPEKRMTNVIEEIADAVVYLTSGPIVYKDRYGT